MVSITVYLAIAMGLASVVCLVWTIRHRKQGDTALRVLATAAVLLTALYFTAIVVITGGYRVQPLDFTTTTEDHEFSWSDPDGPYLSRMREEFALDSIVQDTTDDFERMKRVSTWVHGLWDHDGYNQPQANDPISIVKEAAEGNHFRCVEYSIVLQGALNALGIPARTLGLKTSDVETRESGAGHVVVEAYLQDMDKWVMIDSQFDVIPLLDGIPLSAVELQDALARGARGLDVASASGSTTLLDHLKHRVFYFNWIGQYLYFFDVPLDHRFVTGASQQKLMLVPLGADPPTVFQRKWPLGDLIHTSSIEAFYPRPGR